MRITRSQRLLLASTVALTFISAQPVSVGIKGGVPITDAFETLRGNSSYYATSTKRYLVGPAIQFNLPANLAIEANALYKRLGFQYEQYAPAQPASVSTVANSWEFPVLLKIPFLPGPVKPFASAGGAFRHISGIKQVRTAIDAVNSTVRTEINSAPEFNKRTDVGLVFGGGLEFKLGRARIGPEFRYTRWGSENFRDPVNSLLRTNRNQGDFLLGVMF